jgi:hypothetical protein
MREIWRLKEKKEKEKKDQERRDREDKQKRVEGVGSRFELDVARPLLAWVELWRAQARLMHHGGVEQARRGRRRAR